VIVLWLILFTSGYMYLRLAPLDPFNPSSLPGPLSTAIWSAMAATAAIAVPLFGESKLTVASLAVGTILSPGLKDSMSLRPDEAPSWIARKRAEIEHSIAGDSQSPWCRSSSRGWHR
jgi:hypothetical protein